VHRGAVTDSAVDHPAVPLTLYWTVSLVGDDVTTVQVNITVLALSELTARPLICPGPRHDDAGPLVQA